MLSQPFEIEKGGVTPYRGPSVQTPGLVEAQQVAMENIAEQPQTEDNDVNQMLSTILGDKSDSASLDEILNILKGADNA